MFILLDKNALHQLLQNVFINNVRLCNYRLERRTRALWCQERLCDLSKFCICYFIMCFKIMLCFLTRGISTQNVHVEEESKCKYSITARI